MTVTEQRRIELLRARQFFMGRFWLLLAMGAFIVMGAAGLAAEAGRPWIAYVVGAVIAWCVIQPLWYAISCTLEMRYGDPREW